MHSQALTLQSTVDRTSMSLNELLRLEVTIDKQGSGNIDFSALELQFTIIRRQKNSQSSLINGRISTQTQWTLLLSPKEVGDLLIPSFTINGAYSDAISITVNNSGGSNNKQQTNSKADLSGEVFLTADINKNSVYVQEELLLTLRLHYRVSLSNYTPTELIIDGIKPTLVAENNRQEMVNGQRYNVLEKVYSIHPQSSGEITIPEQVWQVERAVNRFSNSRFKNSYFSARSQGHTITVNAVPKESTAKHWLPTPNLSASQQWEQSIISAKVGEPLNYSVTMTAQGLSHSQLPTITFDNNEQFTIYTDQAKTNDQKSRDGISGHRTQQYAVIPKVAGVFHFPATTITWWNTKTDKEENITFPEQKMIVGNSDLTHEQDNNTTTLLNNTDHSTASHTASDTTLNSHKTSVLLWQLTTLFLLVLSAVLFYLWVNTRKKLSALNNDQHTADNRLSLRHLAKQESHLTSLYSSIEQAIQDQQWSIVKQLLLQWASLSLGKNVLNTDDMTQSSPQLQEACRLLDKTLYGEGDMKKWDNGKQWVELLKQEHQRHKKANNKKHQKASQLPSLYPT